MIEATTGKLSVPKETSKDMAATGDSGLGVLGSPQEGAITASPATMPETTRISESNCSVQTEGTVFPPPPVMYYSRILLGEITPLLAAMKRTTPRWSSHNQDLENDPLVVKLRELQNVLLKLSPDDTLDPNTFLDPFLAVIRSEDTTGPVTKNALASVNRMLNYGLISANSGSASSAVEAIAAAVTHARFVGTDQGADEVVLWEILTVLRTLMLGPVGHLLTNESVCEILNSSFRICFETRLSELLRNCTEDALRHMVQLLFARLPQFKDDPRSSGQGKRLKMRAGGEGKGRRRGKSPRPPRQPSPCPSLDEHHIPDPGESAERVDSSCIEQVSPTEGLTAFTPTESESDSVASPTKEIPTGDTASVDSGIMEVPTPGDSLDISHTHLAPTPQVLIDGGTGASPGEEPDGPCLSQMPEEDGSNEAEIRDSSDTTVSHSSVEVVLKSEVTEVLTPTEVQDQEKEDFINPQGVKFTQEGATEGAPLVPYGMPCVREVLRFLISLTNVTNEQNTPAMIHTALQLLTVALEVGADHLHLSPSLLVLIKDNLCRNLFMLLKPDVRLSIFMTSLRVCCLLVESLRHNLKFQLEMFLNKLSEMITSEASNISYVQKELALEAIVQLWRIPGLVTELFLNFDCDLYASNLFEDLTKVLSKNAFPVQGLYNTNLLSLDALLTVIETLESHGPPKTNCPAIKTGVEEDEDEAPCVVAPVSSGYLLGLGLRSSFSPVTPTLKARRVLADGSVVSREHLLALKEKKKLLANGTDQFNAKPEKGVRFLQDNGIIGSTNKDIALFLKENPRLDKKMIGEYVSKKKNVDILSSFVTSFEFTNLRIDEALRMFLETFRLPGEAPLIAIIIEHFSSHWHLSNAEPFAKDDAAFTLAYAVIMLNVDQHNQNAKKQNLPMTLDQFRNNLRGVNDGKDFNQDMLEEIYNAIRQEEIVMPSEQSGLVKENYMWKMLLRRGATKEGNYVLANSNTIFDRDLFALCWGPTIASLSYVFDKSTDDVIIQKSVSGFRRCATISARYGMSDVFDNLVISLCKFTTLTSGTMEAPEYVTVSFGSNKKAQLAARTVFRLVTSHGDILRDGWRNMLDLLLQLFRCRLLPQQLVTSEDFLDPSGFVTLVREMPSVQRVEPGLLSSLYSYIALGDSGVARGSNPEDAQHTEKARKCITECHPERLITESAFLRCDSLQELLKAMIGASHATNLGETSLTTSTGSLHPRDTSQGRGGDEHSLAFLLELVTQVMVSNKDRAAVVWPAVRDHIYSIMMGAAAADHHFLLERSVVAILRLAKTLLRREEMANQILQSLRMLLTLKPHVLARVSLQVVSGIHEVLSVNAEHVHETSDWAVLFTLLECAGAGAKPPPMVSSHVDTTSDAGSVSDSDIGSSSGFDSGNYTETGYVSDPAENGGGAGAGNVASGPSATALAGDKPRVENVRSAQRSRAASPDASQNTGGWILVGREGEIEPVAVKAVAVNEWDIVHQRELRGHHPDALVRAVDTLAFLVRDHHITPSSLPPAVQACRTFVEATLNGGKSEKLVNNGSKEGGREGARSPMRRKGGKRKEDRAVQRSKSPVNKSSAYDADESDSDDVPVTYKQVSEKLLDLMDTLHTSSGQIVGMECSPAESAISIWPQALCPLLQGIARYCCDARTTIRNLAMTYLQRALLNHDLQVLTAQEWESCFNKVLFPLLAKLLQPLPANSPQALEETRVRAATLVQKVYLRHLTPLLTLPTFTALWLTVLDFMDKYLNTHRSDHLVSEVTSDAIPEILKNMLLVMETTQVFHTADGFTRLWSITWDRIDAFLPEFRHELFKSHPPSEIHRIEVVPNTTTQLGSPSELPSSPTLVSPTSTSSTSTLPGPVVPTVSQISGATPPPATDVCPTLKEQTAARLSLSQESLPTSYGSGIILQPPLPTILPVGPSSSSPPITSLSCAAPVGDGPVGSASVGPNPQLVMADPIPLPTLSLSSSLPIIHTNPFVNTGAMKPTSSEAHPLPILIAPLNQLTSPTVVEGGSSQLILEPVIGQSGLGSFEEPLETTTNACTVETQGEELSNVVEGDSCPDACMSSDKSSKIIDPVTPSTPDESISQDQETSYPIPSESSLFSLPLPSFMSSLSFVAEKEKPKLAPEPIISQPLSPEVTVPSPEEPTPASEPIVSQPVSPEMDIPPPEEQALASEPPVSQSVPPEIDIPSPEEIIASFEPPVSQPVPPEVDIPPPEEQISSSEPPISQHVPSEMDVLPLEEPTPVSQPVPPEIDAPPLEEPTPVSQPVPPEMDVPPTEEPTLAPELPISQPAPSEIDVPPPQEPELAASEPPVSQPVPPETNDPVPVPLNLSDSAIPTSSTTFSSHCSSGLAPEANRTPNAEVSPQLQGTVPYRPASLLFSGSSDSEAFGFPVDPHSASDTTMPDQEVMQGKVLGGDSVTGSGVGPTLALQLTTSPTLPTPVTQPILPQETQGDADGKG